MLDEYINLPNKFCYVIIKKISLIIKFKTMETDIKLSSSNTNFLVNKLLRKIFIIILNFYNIDLKLAYNKKEAYLHFEVSLLVFIVKKAPCGIEYNIATKRSFSFPRGATEGSGTELKTEIWRNGEPSHFSFSCCYVP